MNISQEIASQCRDRMALLSEAMSDQARNASGFLGVTRHGSRFEASIKLDGVNRYLGSYTTPEEAHASYIETKRRLHPGCTI